jgi:hypothetical protein
MAYLFPSCHFERSEKSRSLAFALGMTTSYPGDYDAEGREARRSAGGAADEVRAGDKSQDGEADRPDDSAESSNTGGQSD